LLRPFLIFSRFEKSADIFDYEFSTFPKASTASESLTFAQILATM